MEYRRQECSCRCENPIGTNSFIPRDGNTYCTSCSEERHGACCRMGNQVRTSAGHQDCCCQPNHNICCGGQHFTVRKKPYCADCLGELLANKCNVCNTSFLETKEWNTCCGDRIELDRIYCARCIEETSGTHRVSDNQPPRSGGVMNRTEPGHHECFCQPDANAHRAGQQILRNNRPYCGDCSGRLSANRSAPYCRPITTRRLILRGTGLVLRMN